MTALGGDDAIEEGRVDRHPHVIERAVEAEGHEIAGGADPGAATAEDDGPKTVPAFDLERHRPVVEIHRHVVMEPDEVVDAGDVVAPRFESKAGPIERLGSDELRNIEARFDVARLSRSTRCVHLDELWLHVSSLGLDTTKTPQSRTLFANRWRSQR